MLAAPAHYQLDPFFGSESQWASQIVQNVARAGHRTVALTGHSPLVSTDMLTIESLWGRLGPTALRHRAEFTARYTASGLRWLRRGGIDVLHHVLPFALGWSFNPLALMGPPRLPFVLGPVQTLHGGDLSDEGPESRIFEGGRDRAARPATLALTNRVTRALSLKTLARADVVVAVSEAARDLCLSAVPSANVRVVPPGVDLDHFSPDATVRSGDEIVMVGHLVRRKQVHLLMEAVASLSQARRVTLRLIGEGPERARLEKLALDLGIAAGVIFEGLVPQSHLPGYYRRAAVVCLLSRSESAGMAVLEAMACGAPVLSTKTALITELLRDHKVGVAVEEDPSSVVRGLASLLDNQRMRDEMGQRGRRLMERRHNWQDIAAAYIDAYYDALRLRSHRSSLCP